MSSKIKDIETTWLHLVVTDRKARILIITFDVGRRVQMSWWFRKGCRRGNCLRILRSVVGRRIKCEGRTHLRTRPSKVYLTWLSHRPLSQHPPRSLNLSDRRKVFLLFFGLVIVISSPYRYDKSPNFLGTRKYVPSSSTAPGLTKVSPSVYWNKNTVYTTIVCST